MDARRSQETSMLWVDDDGPARFIYEEFLLNSRGWDIKWACDLEAAAKCLSCQRFSIVILDQIFPIQVHGELCEWSGYHLLAWLRGVGSNLAPQAPNLPTELHRLKPMVENQSVPVVITSGFFDEAMEAAKSRLPCQAKTLVIPKPVDEVLLIEEIERLRRL